MLEYILFFPFVYLCALFREGKKGGLPLVKQLPFPLVWEPWFVISFNHRARPHRDLPALRTWCTVWTRGAPWGFLTPVPSLHLVLPVLR